MQLTRFGQECNARQTASYHALVSLKIVLFRTALYSMAFIFINTFTQHILHNIIFDLFWKLYIYV